MIAAAARHMSEPTARNPPNSAVKNAAPSRLSRPALTTAPMDMNAAIPSTMPTTAKPDAMSGTWRASRKKIE